jgi:hypothetical protein
MPKAQATAASAGASSGTVREASDSQADLEKPINTQSEKTSEGRSAASNTQPVGEGPAGLASQDAPAQSTQDEATSSDNPEEIELIAYQLWLDRGAPHGSPEVDWIEAVRIHRNSRP